jgi:RHS repeat-associated protein
VPIFRGDRRVLGEYGTSAVDVTAEYIWLSPEVGDSGQFGGDDGVGGYSPLAVASGAAQLSWVHGNHLGVPIIWTDEAGSSTAPGDYALAGFPGQLRTLSDLYYNRYRDYDPTTGRYVQADPIGLSGDANPYAYAMNNPLMYSDPPGLKVSIIASDQRQANALMEAYAKLNRSKHGRRITKPLEDSSIDYQIRPITKDAFFCRPGAGRQCMGRRGNTVYVDPCNRIMLRTTNGLQPTDLAIVLAHELGHARGWTDDGPGRMTNVNVNENRVRSDLGYPQRTTYGVPTEIWVP